MSKVIVHRRAARYLQKLPKPHRERIKKILRELEDHPLEFPNARQMLGEWAGYHRIRIGDIRVISGLVKQRTLFILIISVTEVMFTKRADSAGAFLWLRAERQRYPSAEIIFYGSRSKGNEEDWADWDILVLTEENLTEREKTALRNKIFDTELATGEIIRSWPH